MRQALLIGILFALPISAQEPTSLRLTWEHATPGKFPQGLVADVAGRPYLHAAMKNGGLLILDVAASAGPKVSACLGTERFADLDVMHLTQRGHYLFLALGEFFNARGAHAGLAVVDVKDPARPSVLSVWKSPRKGRGSAIVSVAEDYAFLGAMTEGVMIFDVAKPSEIKLLSTFQPDPHYPRKNPNQVQHPNARGLAVRGNRLYVAYDAGGLRVLDISDKRQVKEVGRYSNRAMAKKQEAFNNLVLDKDLAYVACDYAGLEILDISDVRNIRQVGWWNPWQAHTLKNLWFNSPGHTNQIELDARKKLAYLSAGGSELQVVDVSNPTAPRLAARFGGPGSKLGVWGLTTGPDSVYLAYVTAIVPFRGTWSGIKAVER